MKTLLNILFCLSFVMYGQNEGYYFETETGTINSEFEGFIYQNNFTRRAAEDACASAVTLNLGDPCYSGSTNGHSTQTGESFGCSAGSGAGISVETSWYRFNTGTNNSINLSFVRTNTANISPGLVVWGPFAPGTGCLPNGTPVFCQNIISQAVDPGQHYEVPGLIPGMDYLIQVLGRNGGGKNDGFVNYCLGVYAPPVNNGPGAPSYIDQCGLTFNGTNSGYTMSTTAAGDSDLDGNDATQCADGGQCADLGDDVPYIINNDSWFSFCAIDAADYQVDLSGVSNCALGYGIQMSMFTGSSSALSYIESAPSPTAPSSTWTSSTVSLAAGECVYMVVDGFAGDMCDYSYVLTNLTGTCELVLPMELIQFKVNNFGAAHEVLWEVAMDTRGLKYHIEASVDGASYNALKVQEAIGYNQNAIYSFVNEQGTDEDVYYRLVAEEDGQRKILAYAFVKAKAVEEVKISALNDGGIRIDHLQKDDDIKVFNVLGSLIYQDVNKESSMREVAINDLGNQLLIVQIQRRGKLMSFKVMTY